MLFDKGCITNSLVGYPYYMTFFSTAERLEVGGVPFTIPESKPDAARGARVLSSRRAVLRTRCATVRGGRWSFGRSGSLPDPNQDARGLLGVPGPLPRSGDGKLPRSQPPERPRGGSPQGEAPLQRAVPLLRPGRGRRGRREFGRRVGARALSPTCARLPRPLRRGTRFGGQTVAPPRHPQPFGARGNPGLLEEPDRGGAPRFRARAQ